MDAKTFVLGVGCQKGGTTWLHRQLSATDGVDLGFIKEYHVLDVHGGLTTKPIATKLARIGDLEPTLPAVKRGRAWIKHLSFYADVDNYYDYFDYLWMRDPHVKLVGDITPAYGALPAESLSKARVALEARGFNVKVVFLMRDPVERIWSAIRMVKRDSDAKSSEARLVEQTFMTPAVEARTRYEQTIRNLESAFAQEDILYQFYEQLFKPLTHDQIGEFLKLEGFTPDVDQRPNASPKDEGDLPADLRDKIFQYYRETYDYCEERFGTRQIWTSYL